MENTLFSVDLIIRLSGEKQKDWPYKGIIIESDGPYHYYTPIGKDGSMKLTAFSHQKHQLLRAMGYKLIILPFSWNIKNNQASLIMENVAGVDKSSKKVRKAKDGETIAGESDIGDMAREIKKEYENMVMAHQI